MRRLTAALLAAACLSGLAPPAPAGAEPTGVFFSEYVEGSSNNRALELANPTDAPVDLAAGGYAVRMYFNGNSVAGLTIGLAGTVAAGDTSDGIFVFDPDAPAVAEGDLVRVTGTATEHFGLTQVVASVRSALPVLFRFAPWRFHARRLIDPAQLGAYRRRRRRRWPPRTQSPPRDPGRCVLPGGAPGDRSVR